MEALDQEYLEQLEAIKGAIQESEILETYLEEEEDEYYVQMQEYFEPAMQQVFDAVANSKPLQLEALEKEYLDPGFEGLFLPKILGYSVLRGEINENYKYRKPQHHFKDILMAICNSANFEMIKKRIGQTVQVGFALSSDIWITNIIEAQSNKRVKVFLNSLRIAKFRDLDERKKLYEKYSKQLSSVNFASTKFPENPIELKSSFYSLRSFLIFRAKEGLDNTELMKDIANFIQNDSFNGSPWFFELLLIIGLLYDLDDSTKSSFQKAFKPFIKQESFDATFFGKYEDLHEDKEVAVDPSAEQRISKIITGLGSNEVDKFFAVVNEVHSKGFIHTDSIEAVNSYYEAHKGMSLQNECLRASIISYIQNFISNLEPENYPDYISIYKIVIAYIGIFDNEKFNQEVKDVSLGFVKKCIAKFTDKKSRDYQDIKKYVASTFLDLGFLSQKQIVELFKTKRKKPAAK